MADKNDSQIEAPEKAVAVNSGSSPATNDGSTKPSAGDAGPNKLFLHDDGYIKKWLRSLTILHRGHWDSARYYEKINFGLGIATSVAAAISGTSAFAQLQQKADQGGLNISLQITIGIFALLAAALGALQTTIRPSELAARHKQAALKFGKLRREIELHLNLGLPKDPNERGKLLTDFRLRWDTVDEESLPLPKRIYDNVESKYDSNFSHKRIKI